MGKKSKGKNKTAKVFFDKNKSTRSNIAVKDKPKIKLLYHGDSPKVNTGFGVVAREILGRLYKTGKYEIFCLGINDRGDTSSNFEAPGIHHFALPDLHNDPYGIHRMPEVLQKVRPDVIFTLNDVWVLFGSERNRTKHWFIKTIKQHCPHTPWIFYFPIDSRPWTKEWTDLAYSADKTVVYSKYATDVLKEIYPNKSPVFIPHGVSFDRFKILDKDARVKGRKEMGIPENKFMIGFVSRNQPRKNPSAVVEIFKMANEGYRKCNDCGAVRTFFDPKCEYCGGSNDNAVNFDAPLEGNGLLYLHFNMHDPMGLDMSKVVNDNDAGRNLVVRKNHNIAKGVPDNEFTAILNTLDCHFLTTAAEGFGLTVIESMACGVPNISTRTTAVTEQLEEGRGWLVIPKIHWIFDDAANTRKHVIDPEGAIKALTEVYSDWKKRGDNRWGPECTKRVQKGLQYCKAHSWDRAAESFDREITAAIAERRPFTSLFTKDKNKPKVLFVRSGGNYGDLLHTIPAIKKFLEFNPSAEAAYAVPEKFIDIFKDQYDFIREFIAMDRMSDKQDSKDPMQISFFDMTNPEHKIESATYPFIDKTREEIYLMHLGLENPEILDLIGCFNLTDVELRKAAKSVKSLTNRQQDDFVVALCKENIDRRTSWGTLNENWDKLKQVIDKPTLNIKVVEIENIDNFSSNLALMANCDLTICTDNTYLPFLAALDIKTVALISPFWSNVKLRYHRNPIIISKKVLREQGQKEPGEPTSASIFMESITHGEVAAQILSEMMKKKKAREMSNIEKVEEVEDVGVNS